MPSLKNLLDQQLVEAATRMLDNPGDALAKALTDKLPEEGPWRKLALRVGDIENEDEPELVLPLLHKQLVKEGSTGAGRWSWNSTLAADAIIDVDVKDNASLGALGIAVVDGLVPVDYRVKLGLAGELGGESKVGAWSLGLTAGAGVQAELTWTVRAAISEPLLSELIKASSRWTSPHDLPALLRMANDTDWCGLRMGLGGQAQFGLSAAAGREFSAWTYGLDGSRVQLGMAVGVEADFSMAWQGRFMLAVTPQRAPAADGSPGTSGPFGLRVTLEQERSSERAFEIGASFGVDFSGVVSSAERVLRAAWPEARHPLLDALTQPGTAIAQGLKDLIERKLGGELKSLAQLLVGDTTSAALREQLVARLTGSLVAVLDGALGDIAEGKAQAPTLAQSLAQAWLHRLLGRQPVSAALLTKASAAIGDALAQADAGLGKAIEQLRDELKAGAGLGADKLLGPLGELGAKLKGALTRLDGNKVAQEIKGGLATYAAAREKLLAHLGNAQRAKLNLAIAIESSRSRRSAALIDVWFAPGEPGPEALRLYEAICAGRLVMVSELLRTAAATGSITPVGGWLLEASRRVATQTVTLSFFGFEFLHSATQITNLEIKVDALSGNLLLADATASASSRLLNPWRNRSAEIGLTFTATREGGTVRHSGQILAAFKAENEKRDAADLQALLDLWADGMGARNRVVVTEALKPLGDTHAAGFWRGLTLTLAADTSADEWERLLAAADERIDTLAMRHMLRCATSGFGRKNALFEADGAEAEVRRLVRQRFGSDADKDILSYLGDFPESRFIDPDRVDNAAFEHAGLAVARRSFRTLQALQLIAQVQRTPRLLVQQLRVLRGLVLEAAAQPDPRSHHGRLEHSLVAVRELLTRVAVVSETFSGKGIGVPDEGVSWRLAGFLLTLAELCGREVPPAYLPAVQVAGKEPLLLVVGGLG